MGQKTRGTCFRLKARQKLRASQAGAFGAEFDRFDGDGTADDRVGSLVDHTHGPAAEFADNFVTSGLHKRRHRHFRHEGNALFLTFYAQRCNDPPEARPRTQIRLL